MLELRTLGSLELRGSDGAELRAALAQPKRAALLSYLAVARPLCYHRRDTLLALFWPEYDDRRARAALNQALAYLRRVLGENVIVSRGQDELGVDAGQLWCDAGAFNKAVAAGRLEEALDLYGGDLLDGFHVSDAPLFERWLEEERTDARSRACGAAWLLSEREEAEGRAVAAGHFARLAVRLSPLEEMPVRRLIELHGRAGDRAGALSAYDAFARRLRKAYELEPSAEIRHLVDDIRDKGVATPQTISTASDVASGTGAAATTAAPPVFRHSPAARLRAPVALLGLLLAASASWWAMTRPGGVAAAAGDPGGQVRLAVLPFEDLGGNGEYAYFSEAMAQEIGTQLSKFASLGVIAHRSAREYAGREIDYVRAARELGVDHFVIGSVQLAGDRMRIITRLVDGRTREQRWGETYVRTYSVENIFAIQSEVAQAIAAALDARLSVTEVQQVTQQPTAHLQAYELYLLGRHYHGQWDKPGWDSAVIYYQRAIQRDSTFARAYAGLGEVYQPLAFFEHLRPEEAWPRAEAAANRALRLDERLAEAHAVLGWVRTFYHWDWRGAERSFRRAIQLNPSHAGAHGGYGHYLWAVGKVREAVPAFQRSRELDPQTEANRGNLATAYLLIGEYDRATTELRSILDLRPTPGGNWHGVMGGIYLRQGRFKEATAELEQAVRMGSPLYTGTLGYAYAVQGREANALSILAGLSASHRSCAGADAAKIHLGLHRYDDALLSLQEALEQRCSRLPQILTVFGFFDALRSDRRYGTLLRALNRGG